MEVCSGRFCCHCLNKYKTMCKVRQFPVFLKRTLSKGGIFFVKDPTQLCELFRMEKKVRWLLEIFNVVLFCPYIVYKNDTILGNVFTLEHFKNHFILTENVSICCLAF